MSRGRSALKLVLIAIAAIGCQSPVAHTVRRPMPSPVMSRPATDEGAVARSTSLPLSHIRPVSFDQPAAQTTEDASRRLNRDGVEELSLESLIAEVQAVHPSVAAMHAAWQAAAHRYPQVVSLEDPMFGTTLAPASLGSRDVESAYALEVSQKIPWSGKRALRGAAANWEADSAAREVESTRQKLAEVAELAFWDYYLAWRQIDLNAQSELILKSSRDIARTRYETGLVTQQDVLQADVELANLEQRRIELARMEKVAAGRINVLLRRRPDAALAPPPKSLVREASLPAEDLLMTLVVGQRPEIAAAAARVQAEEAKLALTCKNYYPDGEFFGRYDTFWQPRDTQSDLRGQVGVKVNLPLYRDRLNAAVCEAQQQVAKARAEHDQLVLEAQSELQAALEQVRESQRTSALYSRKLIPLSEENVGVARSNYDTSKINFLDLAIAQRQLIEARDRQLQTQVELQRRLATLRRAAGGSLPDSQPQVDPPDPEPRLP